MKRILIEIVFALVLIAALSLSVKSCTEQKKARVVAEQNTEALSADVKHYISESGKTVSEIQGLELSINSLKKVNGELYKDLKDTKIKLKNAQSAVRVVTEYKYINTSDTIKILINDTIAKINLDTEHLKFRADINIPKQAILPNGLSISIPNVQTIATEIKTKGWWIFKKRIGVKVIVMNSNPYIETKDGFYVDLSNKKN